MVAVNLFLKHVAVSVNAVLEEVLAGHLTNLIVILLVSLHKPPVLGLAATFVLAKDLLLHAVELVLLVELLLAKLLKVLLLVMLELLLLKLLVHLDAIL